MSPKSDAKTPMDDIPLLGSLELLKGAGFGNMVGMNTVWLETLSNMSAEVAGFVAERIKEDVKRSTTFCTARTSMTSSTFRHSSSKKLWISTGTKPASWSK